jgi:hypothetical protein
MTAVADLPEHEGTVARLFYWSGLSHTQTGKALDLPAHTVKSRLCSARRRLKETLMAQRNATPRRQTTAAPTPHPETHALDLLTRLSDQEFRLLVFNLPYTIKAEAFSLPSARLLAKLERDLPARGGPRLLNSIRGVGRRSPSRVNSACEHILHRAETIAASKRTTWLSAEKPTAKTIKARAPKAPTMRYQRLRASLPERLATPIDDVQRLLSATEFLIAVDVASLAKQLRRPSKRPAPISDNPSQVPPATESRIRIGLSRRPR